MFVRLSIKTEISNPIKDKNIVVTIHTKRYDFESYGIAEENHLKDLVNEFRENNPNIRIYGKVDFTEII